MSFGLLRAQSMLLKSCGPRRMVVGSIPAPGIHNRWFMDVEVARAQCVGLKTFLPKDCVNRAMCH